MCLRLLMISVKQMIFFPFWGGSGTGIDKYWGGKSEATEDELHPLCDSASLSESNRNGCQESRLFHHHQVFRLQIPQTASSMRAGPSTSRIKPTPLVFHSVWLSEGKPTLLLFKHWYNQQLLIHQFILSYLCGPMMTVNFPMKMGPTGCWCWGPGPLPRQLIHG